MGRKKKHEEHVNHERWLVSYADFITLLFAFFVVMYAISEVDKRKLKKLRQSVQFAFAHVGTGGTKIKGVQVNTFRPLVVGSSFPSGRRDSEAGPFESLNEVRQYVEKSLLTWFVQVDRNGVHVMNDERGVLIRMPAERLFAPRSAALRPDRLRFLEDFGHIVARFEFAFNVGLNVEVPYGVDAIGEHDLGARRNGALVRAIRMGIEDPQAVYSSSVYLEEVDDVETSAAERSRSVFELLVSPPPR